MFFVLLITLFLSPAMMIKSPHDKPLPYFSLMGASSLLDLSAAADARHTAANNSVQSNRNIQGGEVLALHQWVQHVCCTVMCLGSNNQLGKLPPVAFALCHNGRQGGVGAQLAIYCCCQLWLLWLSMLRLWLQTSAHPSLCCLATPAQA